MVKLYGNVKNEWVLLDETDNKQYTETFFKEVKSNWYTCEQYKIEDNETEFRFNKSDL